MFDFTSRVLAHAGKSVPVLVALIEHAWVVSVEGCLGNGFLFATVGMCSLPRSSFGEGSPGLWIWKERAVDVITVCVLLLGVHVDAHQWLLVGL